MAKRPAETTMGRLASASQAAVNPRITMRRNRPQEPARPQAANRSELRGAPLGFHHHGGDDERGKADPPRIVDVAGELDAAERRLVCNDGAVETSGYALWPSAPSRDRRRR